MLPLSEGLWDLPSDLVPFSEMVKPVLFGAFLVTGFTRPPSRTNFLATFDAFQSTLPLFSFAAESELAIPYSEL